MFFDNANRRLIVIASLVLLGTLSACASVAGHNMSEAFPDPRVRQLVQAALNHNPQWIDALVKSGVDVNYRGKEGVTPLVWVLALKDAQAAEELLNAGADPRREMTDPYHVWTVLDLMAGGDSPPLLELLLKHGADPNFRNSDGQLPLSIAAEQGRFENIKLLLKYGADINAHGPKMEGAPWYAFVPGRYDISVYLLQQGYSYNLDQIAAGAETRRVPQQSEQCQWRIKLFDILKQRGVVFPAFPRLHNGEPVSPLHLTDNCMPAWYPKKEAGIAE